MSPRRKKRRRRRRRRTTELGRKKQLNNTLSPSSVTRLRHVAAMA